MRSAAIKMSSAVKAGLDLEAANRDLKGEAPKEIIRWAYHQFDQSLVVSSSFGAHSAVMLHLVSQAAPSIPVILIDTGYHFSETYTFAAELTSRFGLELKVYSATMTAARQEALYGKLWEQGAEGVQKYLWINKVEPMQRAFKELRAKAWLSGVRSEQTEHRRSMRPIECQDGRYKIHPILSWSEAHVEAYLREHALPYHPLYEQGYRSIGDWHSTLPTTRDQDPREGRILGKKKECGLHVALTPEEAASLKSSGL